MKDQEWVKAAMSNDSMVVELLVSLTNPPRVKRALPFDWTVRQPRSKSGPVKPLAHRASPTTPLSLSGGATSFSGGFEESSKVATVTRSKINDDSEKAVGKRSRKKKTLAQLRDEENSLVKERRELTREIMDMRMNLEKQRATNESLKRMKLELLPHFSVSASVQESTSGQLMTLVEGNNATSQSSKLKFVLPDLNMPIEDGSMTEVARW